MFRGINLCGAENNAELPEQHRAHLSRISNQNFTQPMPSCQDRKSLLEARKKREKERPFRKGRSF